jgi:flagellar basal body-associated protein FliL
MKRKAKTRPAKGRGGNLLLIFAAVLVVLILLLRMVSFVMHLRGR